ncbi:MAG: hypothetical protein ACTSWI_05315 [Alphaproteobacteria bacterium]
MFANGVAQPMYVLGTVIVLFVLVAYDLSANSGGVVRATVWSIQNMLRQIGL